VNRAAPNADGIYVALLRGVNVGGKNPLPMRDLSAILENAGCRDVRTYIQSGNVVFRASAARAVRVPDVIAGAIAERHGFRAPVVLRTGAEFRSAASENPFARSGAEVRALHVVFLADRPSAARVRTLEADRSPPDEFQLRGREIYLHCPNGMARTRLTNAYFDTRLATTSTVRNWKTVLKLAEMAGGS